MAYYNFKTEGSSGAAYYLGTLAHGSTMNVAAKYEGYSNLTAANFVIVPQGRDIRAEDNNTNYVDAKDWEEERIDNNHATYVSPTINYNSTTGRLSFSSTLSVDGYSYGQNADSPNRKWCYTYPSGTVGLTAKVYLLPKIENL